MFFMHVYIYLMSQARSLFEIENRSQITNLHKSKAERGLDYFTLIKLLSSE